MLGTRKSSGGLSSRQISERASARAQHQHQHQEHTDGQVVGPLARFRAAGASVIAANQAKPAPGGPKRVRVPDVCLATGETFKHLREAREKAKPLPRRSIPGGSASIGELMSLIASRRTHSFTTATRANCLVCKKECHGKLACDSCRDMLAPAAEPGPDAGGARASPLTEAEAEANRQHNHHTAAFARLAPGPAVRHTRAAAHRRRSSKARSLGAAEAAAATASAGPRASGAAEALGAKRHLFAHKLTSTFTHMAKRVTTLPGIAGAGAGRQPHTRAAPGLARAAPTGGRAGTLSVIEDNARRARAVTRLSTRRQQAGEHHMAAAGAVLAAVVQSSRSSLLPPIDEARGNTVGRRSIAVSMAGGGWRECAPLAR